MKNTQNDVLLLLDENLNQVVEYEYDSWGNIEHILDANGQEITDENHIGNINPYRYRGYRYDNETRMYYLQSRYYNPEWGRFLNADGLISQDNSLLGNNMYAYCGNNPVNRKDPTGQSFLSIIVTALTIYTIYKTVTKAQTQSKTDKSSLPDYSNSLNQVMIKNYNIVKDKSIVFDSFWFKSQVEGRGSWDYKEEERWKADISDPFLEYNGKFLWNNRITTAEEFGNIHYGFMALAMGYPPGVVYSGGGFANIGLSIDIFKAPYYGDSINDHYCVREGMNMYIEWIKGGKLK